MRRGAVRERSRHTLANANEIVVVANLAAFQRNLDAVEGFVIAVRHAERRPGGRWKRQAGGQRVDAELTQPVARRIAARDHNPPQSGLLDKSTLDAPERLTNLVARIIALELIAEVGFGAERRVKNNAVAFGKSSKTHFDGVMR